MEEALHEAPTSHSHDVRGIHHVGITVRDLDRSLAFYRDLLGMRVLDRSKDEDVAAVVGIPGARVQAADLDAGQGQVLELLEYGAPKAPATLPDPNTIGTCHVSLQVDNLPEAVARLETAGIGTLGEIVALTEGGVWTGCTVVYVRDPDGMIIELLEHRADV
jgi:catechol 2,3-dioxygenase-like lactoylglutathione lyase family enzyme